MLKAILGQKKNMSQFFVDGRRTPVTFIIANSCIVTGVKNEEKDGYNAVQLGFGEKKLKAITKPLRGHLKTVLGKAQLGPAFLREVRLNSNFDYKVLDKIKLADTFSLGDVVSVTGVSKGKGFAGVVKRHGFAGGPKTHGQSDRHRAPGAIGQGTTPGRVRKGKKMAGRMGFEKKMVKNLKIVAIDQEKSLLGVSGPVPGRKGTLLLVRKEN